MIIKKTLGLFIFTIYSLISASSFADNTRGFYAGAGLSAIDSDEHFSFSSQDLWAAEITAGYKYNDFLGLELRYGTGASVHTENIYTYVDDIEYVAKRDLLTIDSYTSVYYRLEAINEAGRFYGLLGYTNIDLEVENNSRSISDLSWGIGLGFFMAPKWNLNFEYKYIADLDEAKLTTITASIDYRF